MLLYTAYSYSTGWSLVTCCYEHSNISTGLKTVHICWQDDLSSASQKELYSTRPCFVIFNLIYFILLYSTFLNIYLGNAHLCIKIHYKVYTKSLTETATKLLSLFCDKTMITLHQGSSNVSKQRPSWQYLHSPATHLKILSFPINPYWYQQLKHK